MHRIETLQADLPFEVEFSGSAEADTAVIFVHGFGVKRDSRGMFSAIISQIPEHLLCVRGEFSQVNYDNAVALPFSTQLRRLEAIHQFLEKKFGTRNVIYIAHSQGCIVTALARPKNAKVLLLAPPIISPFQEFIKTPGWRKPGSHLDVEGRSRLVRSDLTIEVEPAFWSEFQKINAEVLYAEMAKDNEVGIIFAGSDEVLGQQQAPIGIATTATDGASHDFKDPARSELICQILEFLGSNPNDKNDPTI